MTDVVVYYLRNTCRYATISNDLYRFRIIQHEDGAHLPASHDLEGIQVRYTYVAHSPPRGAALQSQPDGAHMHHKVPPYATSHSTCTGIGATRAAG